MCSCVSPGRSGPTAVSPTRVGSPPSLGTAAPSNTLPTSQSHSQVRAPGTGGRVSVATGVCVPVTLFGGRRYLEVIVEDTPGPGDSVSLGLPVDGRALSRRGWPLRRPRRRGRRVVAAPAAFGISQEAHPERLGPNADADGLRVGCGEPAHAPGGRSVRGRLEVKALPLGRCLPGCMEGHSQSTSSCAGWRREIQEGPQICCGSAVLGGLDGAESRFLCGVHTCQAGGLRTSLAWSLDAALGGRGHIPADERHCGEAGFHFIFPGG